ncbi:MAG TPA: hypothetical protein VFG23_09190 [Polyangia bacterium]|nr:hypothetical protein [Polyangia bacterium]
MPIRDPPPRLLEPSSLDQLFAAPLKTFVAERKRLADQLEASGKSQAAKELGKTPRPSVSAWIVNQLARQDGPLLRELAALTDRLRDAQVQTAGAKLDGSASELLTAHRAAIKRLRGRAEEILRASGQAVRPQILERVLRNLRVGMANLEFRPTIEGGRLIEDVAAEEGFAGLFGRSDQAPTTVSRSSDGSEDSSGAESHEQPRAPGQSEARSPAHIVAGDDPDRRARRAAAEVARGAAARTRQEAQAQAREQAERARARGQAEVRIRTLQARADGALRSLEKARRDADLARQALAQAEADLRSAELAAQGCAKQLADAQAELENPSGSS